MKHFDHDRSKHGLKPSSLDKEAESGAVTPIALKMFKGRNDEKATPVDCNGAYRHPSDHPGRPSVLILEAARKQSHRDERRIESL